MRGDRQHEKTAVASPRLEHSHPGRIPDFDMLPARAAIAINTSTHHEQPQSTRRRETTKRDPQASQFTISKAMILRITLSVGSAGALDEEIAQRPCSCSQGLFCSPNVSITTLFSRCYALCAIKAQSRYLFVKAPAHRGESHVRPTQSTTGPDARTA